MHTQYRYNGQLVRVIEETGLDPDKVKIVILSTGQSEVVYFHELVPVQVGGAVLS